MTDTPEKLTLRNLTLITVKALASLNKILQEEPTGKRDKKIKRLLMELEVNNDEAMRTGLNLSAQYIARVKTGRFRPAALPTADQNRGNNHAELMKFHFDHIKGPIADAGAQGAAVKFLLDNYAVDILKKCYEYQTTETWRGNISWLTVKRDIGGWLARNGKEPPTRALSASERNEQQLIRNIESVNELRRGGSSGSD